MKQIITSALYLAVIFAVSKFVFEPTHLYYELRWLDIPMHIMGGFGVASLLIAFYAYRGRTATWKSLLVFYSIAAVSWELYEYHHDLVTYTAWNGWFDTTKDYIDGLIGTGLAYLLIRKK
jgi:hypothetical protein